MEELAGLVEEKEFGAALKSWKIFFVGVKWWFKDGKAKEILEPVDEANLLDESAERMISSFKVFL